MTITNKGSRGIWIYCTHNLRSSVQVGLPDWTEGKPGDLLWFKKNSK